MFETLCRQFREFRETQLPKPWASFPRQAGRWGCTASTVTWQPKECTRHEETGKNSQGTRDKSTISTRDKWKITVRDWGEKIQLLQKEWSHPGTRCFAMGSPSLELFKDCLGKAPTHQLTLSCIYKEESSAVTALEQPTSPPSLVCSLIWSHFPPHIPQFGNRTGKPQQWKGEEHFLPQRLSKAEAASAAHPKFFFLFNACSTLYPLRKRQHVLKS